MTPGIDIGPLHIAYYGMIIMLGVVAAAWLSSVEAARRGLQRELVWDALIWLLIAGVIGARVWHILTPPPSMVANGYTTAWYLSHPLDAIDTRDGGLGIPGAVIGGLLALYWFTRRNRLSFAVWADIAAPAVPLGQAIGRFGNLVNQELYGAPTNLPWAIPIDPAHRLPEFAQYERYHPLFLYEALWNIGLMFLILWLGRRYADRLKTGDLLLVYLVGYPVGRFLLEFLRLDSAQIAGLNANQTLMLVVAVFAAGLLFWRHRSGSQMVEPAMVETVDSGPAAPADEDA